MMEWGGGGVMLLIRKIKGRERDGDRLWLMRYFGGFVRSGDLGCVMVVVVEDRLRIGE